MSNKIFIQIASYRDPQLVPTINSILETAKYPENLVFGIARQFNETDGFDNLSQFDNDERFRILNIPHEEAQGVCWARHLTQQLYQDEEYTMQLDSHMRFEPNWDDEFISMIKQLQDKGHEKPLLTGYVSSFDPDNDPKGRTKEPWRMSFDRFIPEGTIFFLPESIPNWKNLTEPVPARFYSAHFCFTVGQFSKEVQHNPEMYFHGEEMSITVRAYTHGYDLFHPHKILVYHEYTRKGRTKHWDDHKNWGQTNNNSHSIYRKLFGMDGNVQEGHDGPFGFGNVRSVRDYEKYSGILFEQRAVQEYTLKKGYPPNPYDYENEEEWKKSFSQIFKHCIDVQYSQVPEEDYDFWVVAFHDEKDETIFRKDVETNEINIMKRDPDGYCKIWREFPTVKKPSYWVVWPHSISKGWGERIVGKL
jgi:hypothetical protein